MGKEMNVREAVELRGVMRELYAYAPEEALATISEIVSLIDRELSELSVSALLDEVKK